MKRVLVLGIGVLALFQLGATQGGWFPWRSDKSPQALTLNASESRIHFIGIKNNAVAVPGTFVGLSGSLDLEKHTAWVKIPVGLLSTGNEVRDLNIRTHYFNAEKFPLARFSIEKVTGAEGLPPIGGSVEVVAHGVLEIQRSRIELDVPVRITREAHARLRVRNTEPLLLTAEQLGLGAGYKVLMAVCGHAALSAVVPIELDLVFDAGP